MREHKELNIALRSSSLANTGNTNRLQNTSFVFEPTIADRKAKRADTTPLSDVDSELLWTGPLAFGTPPQYFSEDFDTGSSE
jgi:hypothetical protein